MVAERYVHEFDAKWLRGGSPAGDALLGSGETQSLADLANSFDMVRTMRAPRLPRMPLCASGCGTCADRAAGTDDDVPGVPPEETVRTVVLGVGLPCQASWMTVLADICFCLEWLYRTTARLWYLPLHL
jgi:hypothetical protein